MWMSYFKDINLQSDLDQEEKLTARTGLYVRETK